MAELFEQYGSVKRVAEELGLSPGLVITYLPYQKTVYDLEEKSGNAKRIDRWRERHRGNRGTLLETGGRWLKQRDGSFRFTSSVPLFHIMSEYK